MLALTHSVAWYRYRLVLAGLLCLMLFAVPSHAKRVALVVGNSAYADKPLKNPVNDAELMHRTLQGLGFDVTLVRNADRRALLGGLRDFEAKARNAEVALFYFAGHGVQVGGSNYLLPLQAQIRAESDVPDEAVDANSVLRRIEDARVKVGLVILDACRDNPYAGATRSSSRGLGRMSAPTGSIVAYATAPGSTADDGNGKNGVYTEQLAKHLSQPGLDLREVFDRTATEVERITQGRQRPREDVGLRGRVVLKDGGVQVASVTVIPTDRPVPAQTDPEQEAWDLAKRRDTVAAYEGFLASFPNGRLAASARSALAGLRPASLEPQPVVRPTQAETTAASPLPGVPLGGAGSTSPGGRPITLVVPSAAGGSIDILARLLATELSSALASPVIVENKPGAGGVIGAAHAGGAAPDGQTLLISSLSMATADALYQNLPNEARQSAFQPIGLIAEFPLLLAARPNLSADSPHDAIAWLKSRSGAATMATSGVGTASHICALALQSAWQTQPTLIPYKGTAPALQDLMSGQVDFMCESGAYFATQLNAGKLKGIGLVSAIAPPAGAVAPSLPRLALPTTSQMTVWTGLYAPKGTPEAVITRLSQALQAATRSANFRAKSESLGAVPITDNRNTPRGSTQFMAAETARFGALFLAAGIAPN